MIEVGGPAAEHFHGHVRAVADHGLPGFGAVFPVRRALADLTGQPLFKLACPNNMIGPVDAYLVAHHGGADAADPASFAAFKPRVAIMNNGQKKGGSRAVYEALHHVQNLQDVWQVHRSEGAGDQNFAVARIANLDESTSHWIKLMAKEDGSFRVLNGRTGEGKSYSKRP